MVIFCDDREDGDVLEMFALTGLDVEVKRLKCGDYVMEGVVIERKTINDFCQSIIDGRIKQQIDRMLENYEHCYLLISGNLRDRTSVIRDNCILGMLSSILVKGVSVCLIDNDRQLVFLMKRIFERHMEMENE